MHIVLCLFGLLLLLLLICVCHDVHAREGFACNYAYTVPPALRGCFRYVAKADDTCASIRAAFKTTGNNVVSTATGNYCADPTTASASNSRAPPLKLGDTFRICPPPDCVYKKLSYETTCGNLAAQHNTALNDIHFRERQSVSPMQPCVEKQQTLPSGTRVQLRRNAALDTQQLLDTHDPTTYEDCKARCHDNTSCTHMLYGNSTCRLFKKATPLMNIASSTRDSNAFRCTSLPTLQYAGALPNEVGNYAWWGENKTDIDDKGNYNAPAPRRCVWKSIARQHPEIVARQQDFVNAEGHGDVDRFLADVCSV